MEAMSGGGITWAQGLAFAWCFCWSGVAFLQRVELGEKLERAGRPIPWWQRNWGVVDREYAKWCSEEGADPRPALRRMRICFLVALPGFVALLVLLVL
jgi:hypothetical protein